jgi:hypothetical protein
MEIKYGVLIMAVSLILGCSDDRASLGEMDSTHPFDSQERVVDRPNNIFLEKYIFLKNMQLGIGLEEVETYLQNHIKDYSVGVQKHHIKFHWLDEEGVTHFLRTNNDSVLRELTYTMQFDKKHPSFLIASYFRSLREMIKEDYGQPLLSEQNKSADLYWQNHLEMNVRLVLIQDTICLKKSVGEELFD